MAELNSVQAVLEHLGRSEVERLTGRKPQHLTNWKSAGRFPSDTYLVIHQALEAAGCSAPSTLWGIRPPSFESGNDAA